MNNLNIFKLIQHAPFNMLQNIATGCGPNVCNMLCTTMLRYVALKCCVRLAFSNGFFRSCLGTKQSRIQISRTPISQKHAKTPITRAKSCFPWTCYTVILPPIFRTPDFSNQFSFPLEVREIAIPLMTGNTLTVTVITSLIKPHFSRNE